MGLKRVLLVEDEPTVAMLIKESLTDLSDKFFVQTASSREEALGHINDSRWDLVVTDNRIPGITGLELIENLHEKTPSTRTILMTAYASEDVEEAARRLKVYRYMTKPFPLADLKHIIQDALTVIQGSQSDGTDAPFPGESKCTVKVTLGGDCGVGKTSLIRRLCTGQFRRIRAIKTGVEFHIYDVPHDSTSMQLIIWDMSGQDHLAIARHAFYGGSSGVGLVYDVSNRKSFEHLNRWYEEIRETLPRVPLVLTGNKADAGREVNWEEGRALADSWGVPFHETSCATGYGVREFFSTLADRASKHRQLE